MAEQTYIGSLFYKISKLKQRFPNETERHILLGKAAVLAYQSLYPYVNEIRGENRRENAAISETNAALIRELSELELIADEPFRVVNSELSRNIRQGFEDVEGKEFCSRLLQHISEAPRVENTYANIGRSLEQALTDSSITSYYRDNMQGSSNARLMRYQGIDKVPRELRIILKREISKIEERIKRDVL